jgi:hypothetical protein
MIHCFILLLLFCTSLLLFCTVVVLHCCFILLFLSLLLFYDVVLCCCCCFILLLSIFVVLQVIVKDTSIMLTPAHIKSFILMTLQGLEYLHLNWILHRVSQNALSINTRMPFCT